MARAFVAWHDSQAQTGEPASRGSDSEVPPLEESFAPRRRGRFSSPRDEALARRGSFNGDVRVPPFSTPISSGHLGGVGDLRQLLKEGGGEARDGLGPMAIGKGQGPH
jgi:hypothetical protein